MWHIMTIGDQAIYMHWSFLYVLMAVWTSFLCSKGGASRAIISLVLWPLLWILHTIEVFRSTP